MKEPRMAASLVLYLGVTEDYWKRTYRQLAAALVPGLPDILRCRIFDDYPTSFLSSASAVRVYLKAREGWIEQTGLTVSCFTLDLLHSCYL
jgi:hypothetical protein